MTASREFARIVTSSRQSQLVYTRQAIRRMDAIYRNAARDVSARLRAIAGTGSLQEAQQTALLSDLNRILDGLRDDYNGIFGIVLLGSAQIAADREASIIQTVMEQIVLDAAMQQLLPTMTRSVQVGGIGEVSVSFGHVAERAVQATFERVYRDGLTLSDRIWRLDAFTRRGIEDTIVQGIAEQTSARRLSKQLTDFLTAPDAANARYNAMRLARTEINTAHREATVQSALSQGGVLQPWIKGLKWLLSSAHTEPDICDEWASADPDGLGAGIYLPGNVPVDHPNGLCDLTPVLVREDIADPVSVVKPQPDKVSDAQKKYYGIPVEAATP
jgi:hypothetical protein